MKNRLADATSPYLRQHAHNPVHWQPWDAEAPALARERDVPILLSIGYSACHWCHVMAHESFEDAATAATMNSLYVNIKVDREERPDLDKIYQLAHQALSGRGGGWPLTVFLTPDDLMPFYAGTYFPKEARHGLPPFVYVLQQVRMFWDTRRDELRRQNATLADFLAEMPPPAAALDEAPLDAALAWSRRALDSEHGGHHGAPKFPHATELEFLLDYSDPDGIATTTLRAMAGRGLYDHIGGGFFRYCVDARWEIPHFEKMLYDNAQLLPLYARLGNDAVARGIVNWLEREMAAPGGAFYSTLDADSEGEEGRFYVWRRDEVQSLLAPEVFAAAAQRYGLDRQPNFEQHAWHLAPAEPVETIANRLGITAAAAAMRIDEARATLFCARERRVRPGRDDKILTAWNALLASGLARAARALDTPEYARHARAILDFARDKLWHDSRLYACFAGGEAQFPAYLDDHAFLLDALIEQLQTDWLSADLDWATTLAETLLARFEDAEHGGFHFTAHDHESLPFRPKPWTDDSLPSGNGIAARALLRLGHLVGETRWIDAAERTLRAAGSRLVEAPQAAMALVRALDALLRPRDRVVVRCTAGAAAAWRDAAVGLDVYVIPPDAANLPGLLAAMPPQGDGVAYLCRDTRCLPPLGSPATLRDMLR